MSFTSWIFVAFVALTVLLYYVVPRRARWVVLLAASYGFYLSGGVKTVAYLLATTLTTYFAGLLLGKLNLKAKDAEKDLQKTIKRQKKWVVFFALLFNFGMLFAVKYLSFTVELLHLPLTVPEILLPLGISFYIFQSVGYVIDCYRDKHPAEKNVLKFALFTSFFPQMVQGPISRWHELAPQLIAGNDFDAKNLQYGLQRMLWGYLKKMVIAERAGVIASTVFGNPQGFSGSVQAFAVLMYCIQLYCDFSGGIDITIGVAELFGIRLAENFRRPLFATSLADYWRRWHITLGTWMRDYLFYPLTLSKPLLKIGKWSRRKLKGKIGKILPTSIATFIIYLVIGIWHGANFRYIAYGLWNGLIITSSFLLEGVFVNVNGKLGIKRESTIWRIWQMVRTAILVFIGRYITRAPRLITGVWMFSRLFTAPQFSDLTNGTLLTLGLAAQDLWIILAGEVILFGVELLQEKDVRIRDTLAKRHWLIQWLAILLPMAALLFFGILRGSYIPAAFIYQQY